MILKLRCRQRHPVDDAPEATPALEESGRNCAIREQKTAEVEGLSSVRSRTVRQPSDRRRGKQAAYSLRLFPLFSHNETSLEEEAIRTPRESHRLSSD